MRQLRVVPFEPSRKWLSGAGGRAKWLLAALCLLAPFAPPSRAETLKDALSHAYRTNPQLNAQRANTRSVDENLPIVRGTFLPTVNATGNYNLLQQDILGNEVVSRTLTHPAGGGLVVNLNVFNGFRGVNGIDQAKAQIFQSRQLLRNTENTVLANGAAAYMNVLRDSAVFKLRDNQVRVLAYQVESTKQKFLGGEVTQTDISQAEAALAQARLDRSTASVALQSSAATYRQIIGKSPGKLAPVAPVDKTLPKSVRAALQTASASHPLALAARYNVDINELAVKIVEGQLLPTVNLTGSVNQQYNYIGYVGRPGQRIFQGTVGVQVNVPIYEGGVVYAQARQAKERLGEAKFLYDQQINQINQTIEAAWAAWKESGKVLAAAREQASQAESALAGVREEAKIGLRTTWDILNALQTLANARIVLVNAQRDRTLYGFALLSSMGQLSTEKLDLGAPVYDATIHYEQVKDQWIGLEAWDPPAAEMTQGAAQSPRSFVANVQNAAATETVAEAGNRPAPVARRPPDSSDDSAARREAGVATRAPLNIAPPADAERAKLARPSGRGWMIQIGAAEDEDEANRLLASAHGQIRRVAPASEAFVEKVQKGKETRYRARFAGFDRRGADDACKTLTRVGFSCFATAN